MIPRRLIVKPVLPDALQGLQNVAKNLWFSWNPDAGMLFRSLDPDLWEASGHNPVKLLADLSRERMEEIVSDAVLMNRIQQLERDFEDYVGNTKAYSFNLDRPINYRIAYFSMEYGIHESLPIYSGGLGILAGDHLKSSSNLGIPLAGVGLLYQKGYFTQYLNVDGWQQESYPDNDFYNLPVTPVRDAAGKPAWFELEFPGETVKVLIWRVQVGRISLYLLDTNHPDNTSAARQITAELYGGDAETRIRQEIVLGIGGARALHLMGLWPSVYHLNEGHAAFAGLERMRQTMQTYRVSFDVALRSVAASTVFTTHTPVPAGIDLFSPDLVERYFSSYMQSLGMSVGDLLDLGRENPGDVRSPLSMAVLAIRISRGVNGVSKIHGQVARAMWRGLWPDVDDEDVPIDHVTNGVHIPSFVSRDMADLFARYLGKGWIEEPDNNKIWSRIHNIPHDELWTVHETRRERLVIFCRRRVWDQMKARGATAFDTDKSRNILNPEALTIGFARRFAPYKRASLLFTDMDRLKTIVGNKDRPIQFIFAGKAHPRDNMGKELIKNLVHHARSDSFRRSMVFLEDYDINIARYLVQGVDVWLNNPRRPLEACGTSGMKAAANGALNLSILDGWWPEAYDGSNGWAIGDYEEYDDQTTQDTAEARMIYELLEREVIPLFFDRGPDGLPHGWIEMMKNSMKSICGRFNSHRMVEEYTQRYYVPAGNSHQMLGEDRLSRAKELAAWKKRVLSHWKGVQVLEVSEPQQDKLSLGETLAVEATIQLGALEEQEVLVDLCFGPVHSDTGRIHDRSITAMMQSEKISEGVWRFRGNIPCEDTGVYGYAVRILPFHPLLLNPLIMNLVTWG